MLQCEQHPVETGSSQKEKKDIVEERILEIGIEIKKKHFIRVNCNQIELIVVAVTVVI